MTPADKLDRHLTASIRQFSKSERDMRGMQRLAHITANATKAIDAKADAVADRIVAGQARAEAAIGKFDELANSIEQTADEVEAALGQISNDPTERSGG